MFQNQGSEYIKQKGFNTRNWMPAKPFERLVGKRSGRALTLSGLGLASQSSERGCSKVGSSRHFPVLGLQCSPSDSLYISLVR